MTNPGVAILMSTYNGETYLVEQIDSILKQTYENIHLFIRDDGSTDGTLQILEKFADNSKITIIEGEKNLGYKNSFLYLLKVAVNERTKYQYFAFSDQDDVWLPEKLKVGVQHLESIESAPSQLYYSSLLFVDSSLNYITKKNFKNFNNTFGAEMVRNSAAGSTMVFSKELANLAIQTDDVLELPDGHDAWIFKLNLAVGGSVYYDENSYILFRRHANTASNAGKKIIHKILSELNTNDVAFATAKILLTESYSQLLISEAKNLSKQIACYKINIKNRMQLLRNKSLRREKKIMNYILYFKILTKTF